MFGPGYRERQKTKSSDMQVLLDEKEAQLEAGAYTRPLLSST